MVIKSACIYKYIYAVAMIQYQCILILQWDEKKEIPNI